MGNGIIGTSSFHAEVSRTGEGGVRGREDEVRVWRGVYRRLNLVRGARSLSLYLLL